MKKIGKIRILDLCCVPIKGSYQTHGGNFITS